MNITSAFQKISQPFENTAQETLAEIEANYSLTKEEPAPSGGAIKSYTHNETGETLQIRTQNDKVVEIVFSYKENNARCFITAYGDGSPNIQIQNDAGPT